jgi:hypothetical protein
VIPLLVKGLEGQNVSGHNIHVFGINSAVVKDSLQFLSRDGYLRLEILCRFVT